MLAGPLARALLLASLLLARTGAQTRAVATPVDYAAQVDARFDGADGARADGVPTYHTLGAALAAAPRDARAPWRIHLKAGRYREKLTIDKPFITLVGDAREVTVITYDAAADTPDPQGHPYGTRGSFTLRVAAPDVHLEHLAIENAFDYLANARKAADDPARMKNAQALALSIDAGSDRASFDDVHVTGHQDTLYPNAGRSYFHHSTIEGSVDFIFGAGRAVFEDCDVISRDRGSATNNGYVTAPSTPRAQPVGFVFIRSRIRKETPTMASASVVLGRPWHPGADATLVPSAVFVECWMDDRVSAKGWDRMSMLDSTGTRIWWEPATARFFEYHSRGPGGAPSADRRQLSDAEVPAYARERALDGWIPPGAP
jgi:pectinesterase